VSRLEDIRNGHSIHVPNYDNCNICYLISEVKKLREGLRSLEWGLDDGDGYGTCSACLERENKSHKPDCWLAALLKDSHA
jgi:hypothetical protein